MTYTVESLKNIWFFLDRCGNVMQKIEHHPEGSVLNHSIQCFNWACRESNDINLIFAALLHDIGKHTNTYGHEDLAVEWLEDLCSVKTLWLIQHHMRIHKYLNGEMKKLSSCKYLAAHPWLSDLIQLARFDQKARNPNIKFVYDKQIIVDKLNKVEQMYFDENKTYINYLMEKGLVTTYDD